ncbi:MAG: aminotransferase class I/II-fold pyridoxal phosphate-dependent enzyme, partial [Leeuwenhoekiella sp.]
MEISQLKIQKKQSLKDALIALDANGLGTLFVLDDSNKLVGVITDGDIRRFLLKNNDLEHPVHEAMNTSFVFLSVNADNASILGKISKKIKLIPLVDDQDNLVDYASLERLHNIPISSPLLAGNELKYITECIKTNWISSQGKFVKTFEQMFEAYHEDFSAIAVSNGTVALHLALEALGIGVGDEVIVPDLTFAASVNAVLYAGATPVLATIDKTTWNIDVAHVEKLIGPKTKAIMPVHLYGLPCDMNAIVALAKKHELLIVEDCAEALGSRYDDRPVGVFGDAATFSFFGNKTITTGEGGMIVFRDKKVAERAAVLRDHGMSKTRRYWHDEVGFNYRLTNMQAAIGVAQFERLDEFVERKRKNAAIYNSYLDKIPFFQTPAVLEDRINSFWLYTFMVSEEA